VRLVFLDTGHDIDVTRLTARHGHFFPAGSWTARSMIWRRRDRRRIICRAADGTPEELVAAIICRLNLADAAGG
jgi:gluconate kinase